MARTRVAVLGHTAALGGCELSLTRMLTAIDTDRFDVVVVCFSDGPLVTRLRAQGVRVEVHALSADVATAGRHDVVRAPLASVGRAVTSISYALGLARTLRRLDVDVVHANTLKAYALGTVAAHLARRPLVWHVHDRISSDYLPVPVVATLRFLAAHDPAEIVVNSAATARTLAADPRRPAQRITIAYPGLEPHAFDVARPAPSGGRAPVVGMLGRISPTKGQHEFVRAVAALARDYPQVHFRLIGAPLFNEHGYDEDLTDLIRALDLDARVERVGWVDDPQSALRELDLLVHASPTPEPFGQVVVEAMAAKVPVIATLGGGVGEILDPTSVVVPALAPGRSHRTELGWLVPPSDPAALAHAMRAALDDPDSAGAAAEVAWTSASTRFTAAGMAAAVSGVWDRVATQSPRRRRRSR
ncbi:glycosyltransferase [Luteipulveratus flavus]|uniref:Glycosyltransferase n=1 Tax=Luteipulveratus flavus TaxID=3031728 RepID=A0ABT6CGR4_9MICO|nr:glycosyltransferase [Luteipulveratus sp. YIM 133296]MDF8266501.1 glycosyltransferase [Luteipulveratus sp. YIM 133296]